MDKQTLVQDIASYLADNRLSVHRFAKDCGVDVTSLHLFLKHPEKTLNLDSFFKLWKFLYGDQKPILLSSMPGFVHSAAMTRLQEKEKGVGDG